MRKEDCENYGPATGRCFLNGKSCRECKRIAKERTALCSFLEPERSGSISLSRCNICGTWIRWIRMKPGKDMPVDPYPVGIAVSDSGNTVIVTENGRIIKGTFTSGGQAADITGYIPHLITCQHDYKHEEG